MRTRSKKSEKRRFDPRIQRHDHFHDVLVSCFSPRFLRVTRSPPSEHRALLPERLEQWLSQHQQQLTP